MYALNFPINYCYPHFFYGTNIYNSQILHCVNFFHRKLCVTNLCVIQLFYYTVLTFVQLIVPNSESDSINDYYRWHHHLIFIHKFLFINFYSLVIICHLLFLFPLLPSPFPFLFLFSLPKIFLPPFFCIGTLQTEEIQKIAELHVSSRVLFQMPLRNAAVNGCMDARLGISDKISHCQTCK